MYTQKLLKLNENLGFYFSFHVLTHLTTVFIDIIIMYYYDRLQNRERENGENGAGCFKRLYALYIMNIPFPTFFCVYVTGDLKSLVCAHGSIV